jgi:predicted transcriptional regulator
MAAGREFTLTWKTRIIVPFTVIFILSIYIIIVPADPVTATSSEEVNLGAPIYPELGLFEQDNSSALVEWILTRMNLTVEPSMENVPISYPLLLRASVNGSFIDELFWGYQMREHCYQSLEIMTYYDVSGRLTDYVISFREDPFSTLGNGPVAAATSLANSLAIPVDNASLVNPSVIKCVYGQSEFTVVIFGESRNGIPLVGMNLAAFWFDDHNRLKQIQSFAYYEADAPKISADEAALIGKGEADHVIGSTTGTSFINASITGLRLTPIFPSETVEGNVTQERISGYVLSYEYLANMWNADISGDQGLIILIDSQDGTIRYEQAEHLPVDLHGFPFPYGEVVILFGFFIVGIAILTMTVPSVSLLVVSLLAILMVRLKGPAVLDNFNRGRIVGFVSAKPGSSYSEIKEAVGISNGTLSYHLIVLEKLEILKSVKEGRTRHYYSTGVIIERSKAAYLGTTEAKVLQEIERLGTASNSDIAERLGMSRQRSLHNIKLLAKKGLIEEEASGWKATRDAD